MSNKEIKNIIDNITVWYELNIEWLDYTLIEIDWEFFTFECINNKSKFKVLDSWELFDILYEEILEFNI